MNRELIFAELLIMLVLIISSANGQMTLHHIDVAQGDATLVEFQTAAVLVDVGGSNSKVTKDALIAYLDDFFARRTDLNKTLYSVIITHPHADHLRWIKQILQRYTVLNLVDNGDSRNHGSVAKMKEARRLFNQQRTRNRLSRFYNRIDAADIGPEGYITKFFHDLTEREPLARVTFVNASRRCKNPNYDSVVVIVEYGSTKALITGDAEDAEDARCVPAIPRMLQKFEGSNLMDVDVYKAGHHGSHNGTNLPYLEMISPKISIISSGADDDDSAWTYGHPRISAIEQMIARTTNVRQTKPVYGFPQSKGDVVKFEISKAVYCTCWDGNIRVRTDTLGRLLPVLVSK